MKQALPSNERNLHVAILLAIFSSMYDNNFCTTLFICAFYDIVVIILLLYCVEWLFS